MAPLALSLTVRAATAEPAGDDDDAAPRMSAAEQEALDSSELREAVAASERAYEDAGLRDEAAMIELFLTKIGGGGA